MVDFADWNLISWEFLYTTLVIRYGWVLALAVVVQVLTRTARPSGTPAEASRWLHLPVLCWGLMTGWRHLDFWYATLVCFGSAEIYVIVAYESLLALCAVCTVQVTGLTLAGRPAWTLGTTGHRRVAMTAALLTVTLDVFLSLHVLGYFRHWRL